MDSELKGRVLEVVRQLARHEQQRLRAAGTFVQLEQLACEIGDEVTRQLLNGQLTERCQEVANTPSQPCPDCGQASSQSESRHRELDGLRGTIAYDDLAYHCPSCRRDFFPGRRLDGLVGQSQRDAQVDREDGVGRQ